MKICVIRFLVACAALSLSGTQCTAGPGTVEHTLKVGELNRTYNLHVPTNLPPDKPAPLVLVFHGGGGTAAGVERQTKFSELADGKGFMVAYPEGIGQGWNDGRGVKDVRTQRIGVNDLAFVAALLADIAGNHRIDARRVYATGISNGGIFSHYLAANMSQRIAAIAPVVGGIPEAMGEKFKPEKPISVLILQGVDDPLVPYRGGPITLPWGRERAGIIPTEEAVRKWVEYNACRREAVMERMADKDPGDGCRVLKFTYTEGKDNTEVVLYQIEGGGHTWPGGAQYLRKKLIGKVCRDINATEVIWEFFKAHPKP